MFLPILRIMMMKLHRWRFRLSLCIAFLQLPPLFVVLIAEEIMVHLKIHQAHRGNVVKFLVLFEYIFQAFPVSSSLTKSRDQACGVLLHKRLFLAIVDWIGNDSDASAKFTEFSHGWLDYKVDEAHLA